MRMKDYGVWAEGEDYDSREWKPEVVERRWYREGEPGLLPTQEQIDEHHWRWVHFTYYVFGKEKASFQVVIDEDGSEPFELKLFAPKKGYISCCLVTRKNIWEKLSSMKLLEEVFL